MAQRAKRPAEAWWYVLTKDRELPREEQSRFLLRPLTQAERMRVWDDFSVRTTGGDGTTQIADRSFQQAYGLALSNIAEVENFPAGEPQAWPSKEAARRQYLNTIDDMDVWELGNEIRERSSLDREAAAEADAEAEEHSVPNS